jgi:hypothetical protein
MITNQPTNIACKIDRLNKMLFCIHMFVTGRLCKMDDSMCVQLGRMATQACWVYMGLREYHEIYKLCSKADKDFHFLQIKEDENT